MRFCSRDHRKDSVARTLDLVGDGWTFLVLREAFFGVRRFDAFQNTLGIATNILADRLRRLTRDGIFERQRDPEDGRRFEYRLTERGRDLYWVTLALMRWGDKWLADGQGPPLQLTHDRCGKDFTPQTVCSACGEEIDPREVSYRSRR